MKTQKRKLYWLVDSSYGDPDSPITLEEFKQGCRELGWPVPNLVEDPNGILVVRVYIQDFATIYDGDPEFDRHAWLVSGANWRPVLKPVSQSSRRSRP